jgi:hypothetical protein
MNHSPYFRTSANVSTSLESATKKRANQEDAETIKSPEKKKKSEKPAQQKKSESVKKKNVNGPVKDTKSQQAKRKATEPSKEVQKKDPVSQKPKTASILNAAKNQSKNVKTKLKRPATQVTFSDASKRVVYQDPQLLQRTVVFDTPMTTARNSPTPMLFQRATSSVFQQPAKFERVVRMV